MTYSAIADNFYKNGQGQGEQFYLNWRERRGEFPKHKVAAPVQEPIAEYVVRTDAKGKTNAICYARAGAYDLPVGSHMLYTSHSHPEQVTWGVDWGSHGDRSCVSIIKKHQNGTIEVVATEYEPPRNRV